MVLSKMHIVYSIKCLVLGSATNYRNQAKTHHGTWCGLWLCTTSVKSSSVYLCGKWMLNDGVDDDFILGTVKAVWLRSLLSSDVVSVSVPLCSTEGMSSAIASS